MKMMRSLFTVLTAAVILCMSQSTALAKDETKRITGAVSVMKDIGTLKKSSIPPALIKNASAVAIIPGAAKNDFMVSGKSAGGVLLVNGKDGKWSNPLFISLSGGTLGWQIVGGPMDIILLFKNKERVDAVIKGKLNMDVKVKVVQGPLGKNPKAAPKEVQQAEINSYVRSHGDFYDVTVAGSTIRIDNAANDDFYGKKKVGAEDIVSGKVEKPSDDVKNLQKLIAEFADKK